MEQYTNLETHLNRHLGIQPHRCPHVSTTPHPHQPDKLVRKHCTFRTCDPADLSMHRRLHDDYVPQRRKPRLNTRRRGAVQPRFICTLPAPPSQPAPQPATGEAPGPHKRKRQASSAEDSRPAKCARREPKPEDVPSAGAHESWSLLEPRAPLAAEAALPPSDLWLAAAADFEPSSPSSDSSAGADSELGLSDGRSFAYAAYRGCPSEASLSQGSSSARSSAEPVTPPAYYWALPPDALPLLWSSALDKSSVHTSAAHVLTPHDIALALKMANAFDEVMEIHAHAECWCHH